MGAGSRGSAPAMSGEDALAQDVFHILGRNATLSKRQTFDKQAIDNDDSAVAIYTTQILLCYRPPGHR